VSQTKYRRIESNGSRVLPIYLVSRAEKNRRIVRKRGVFKWLPVFFENDHVHGAWYFVAGSALSALIPCVPLFGLYMPLLEVVDILPLVEHTSAYGLLAFIGVLYTLGSFAYLRANVQPKMPPLFTWRHFATDELLAMWLFTLGTAPSIPVMALYVIYNPSVSSFQLALAVTVIVTIAMVILTTYCYPREDHTPRAFFVNLLCVFCCKDSCWGKHLANDWLLGCWLIYLGTLFGCVCAVGLLAYYIYHRFPREVYDWSTGLFDLVLYLLGSMYVLAGSYPEPSDNVRAAVRADHKQWMTSPQPVRSSSSDDERDMEFWNMDQTNKPETAGEV